MPNNVQMEPGREAHVGFKSQCLLLLFPSAHRPLHRKRPRQQLDREVDFVKPAGRQMQRSFQARAASAPLQTFQASLAQASRLHPFEHADSPPPVIADKPAVPDKDQHCRQAEIDHNPAPHVLPLWENRTSLRCDSARGGNEKNSAASQICPRLFSRYNGGVPFRIRKFQKADFETLWRIDQACFDPQMAYSRPELAFYMRRPGAFTLVAEEQMDSGKSAIIGFIVAEARRRSGHIITIDVVAGARRLGVGSALLTAVEEQLRAAGVESIALETAVNNEAAIRFYKGKSYFVERTIRGYYSGQLDALEMVKELAQPACEEEAQ